MIKLLLDPIIVPARFIKETTGVEVDNGKFDKEEGNEGISN